MPKILYFSTRYPEPLREAIVKNILFSDSASAVVFSDAIFHGMVECGLDFVNVNNPPVGYWPQMNKKLWIQTQCCEDLGRKVWNIGAVNLYGYQYFSIFMHTYRAIRKILKGEAAVCVVYAINIPILRAILRYREYDAPKTKIILVIPDLVEDMYSDGSFKSKIMLKLHGDIEHIYKQMDGFVYLSEQMREKTKSVMPYCVVEGIYDTSSEKYEAPEFNGKEKIIFYSGKLEEKFGARLLVDAFCMIPDDDARLLLCGSGDSVEYVKERAAADKRIRFMGQIPREEVIRLQSKARLLVNPRTPEGEFTRYSFPSKNIQYLASGIPTLIYRLEGIPEEYYRYCLTVDGNMLSAAELSQSMRRGINIPTEECVRMGNNARLFILENKNAKKQVEKIVDLIKIVQTQ